MIETATPIGWSESYGGFWVVTGWEEIRDIVHDTEAFSNRRVTFPSYGTPDGSLIVISQYDEPDHKKYRRLVQAAFSPAKAAEITEALRVTVNDLIDEFIDLGRIDIVEALTNEVPARLTAIILGLPPEQGRLYRTWTHAMAQQVHTDPDGAAAHMRDF